jgi:hypothetical protein
MGIALGIDYNSIIRYIIAWREGHYSWYGIGEHGMGKWFGG